MEFNEKNGITPTTVMKNIPEDLKAIYGLADGQVEVNETSLDKLERTRYFIKEQLDKLINKKTKQMQKAAGNLDFETAAEIRDEIRELKEILFELLNSLGFMNE